jgi:hypothetical protein
MKMTYKKFSQTSSGWEISEDTEALPEKRWRIKHPEWGTRYYPTHEDASRSALTEGVERLRAAFKALFNV